MVFGTLLLLALALAFVWYVLGGSRAIRSRLAPHSDPVYDLQGLGEYEIEVVGESHYQRALEIICGGRTEHGAEKYVKASLVLEDDNQYDDQAVRIDIDGVTVGYLPRPIARIYRMRIRQLGHPRIVGVCNAVIRGGWDRGPSDRGNFGVWLDIPAH